MTPLELLTRKLSHKLILSDDIIDRVITFQWKSARAAIEDETITSVELTNLGTFSVRPGKLGRDIKKLQNTVAKLERELPSCTDEKEIEKSNKKKRSAETTLEFLLKKQQAYEAKL